MATDPDLEKAEAARRDPADVERPPTASSAGSGGHDDDLELDLDRDVEKQAAGYEHDDDDDGNDDVEAPPVVVHAATVGEPSGSLFHEHESGPSADAAPPRGPSGTSSTRSRPPLTVVPRSQRRGLFGRFSIVPEVERPYDYKNSTKWGITATIAMATAGAPMGSSIFFPSLGSLTVELNTTATVANLSSALYMISMAIFPIWWSAFSEQFGRRSIYLISFALFVGFSILCGFSVNITMLIVFRICAGGASASVQAVGAGTLADLWEPRERGRAMSMFYLPVLLAPLLAPIIGGVLSENFGWTSTMWFLAAYGFVTLIMLFFLLPETLARRPAPARTGADVDEPGSGEDLGRKTTASSAGVQTKKFARGAKQYLVDPLKVLLYLRLPPVLITVLIAAIAFTALFIANIAIQQQFARPPYNYNTLVVGLLYIPPGLGYFSCSFFGGRWIDHIMAREAKKAGRYDANGKLIYLPEDRMRENAWIANTAYPLGLLMFGWSLRYGVHFMVPSIALYVFGVFSMLTFTVATTMLTEFVRKRSSAAVAVNNFVRNILSCVGVVVSAPWIDAMGTGWVFTILCGICLFGGYLGIWVLRRNAQRWRVAMDEALKDT